MVSQRRQEPIPPGYTWEFTITPHYCSQLRELYNSQLLQKRCFTVSAKYSQYNMHRKILQTFLILVKL